MSYPAQSIPANMREKHDTILSLIEPFCREHLNPEYLSVCANLLATLARKRPSPLVTGKPAVWACGVVRVIGMVNFLDDRSRTPHMKVGAVDDAFGVSTATAGAKSKTIRDLLKIRQFDPKWTLPSKIGDNPMVWLVQVNGFIADVRHMPREVQEEAFERGMIPYLPGGGEREDANPTAT